MIIAGTFFFSSQSPRGTVRYCAKEFLSLSYVQKHENNVCKKKSQIAMNIYKEIKQGKKAYRFKYKH